MAISPIEELYYKMKYLFTKQIKTNWVAYCLFLEVKSRTKLKNTKESFIKQVKELERLTTKVEDKNNNVDIWSIDKTAVLGRIREQFSCGNRGLVDSVRTALRDPGGRDVLRLLLRVDFSSTDGGSELAGLAELSGMDTELTG